MTESPKNQPAVEPIALKDPALAAFLAWLIPGLGHLYQRRYAKAALFFVCIMGTFVYGLYLGGNDDVGWGRAVYASWRPTDKRLYYLCQIGIGLPAMPAMVQAMRVRQGHEPFGRFMAPPRLEGDANAPADQLTLCDLNRRLSRYFELGTIYTAVAGLLNILAVFDAWAGPVLGHGGKKEEEEEKEAATKDAEKEKKS